MVLGVWRPLRRAGGGGFSLLSAVGLRCSSSPGGRGFSRPLPRTLDSSRAVLPAGSSGWLGAAEAPVLGGTVGPQAGVTYSLSSMVSFGSFF